MAEFPLRQNNCKQVNQEEIWLGLPRLDDELHTLLGRMSKRRLVDPIPSRFRTLVAPETIANQNLASERILVRVKASPESFGYMTLSEAH